ncbi:5-(carboxyamino)imidazole ribonucleotide synthase [Pigmentiphaga sp. NML080357]|uniref:5-(carboxyamino)imidazole ribonucleotide synthase n=1 Tax=Pigmentiphaga sp. NML080357 TaxID=2008675 RepID=UPI000B42343D|nr:5-(carboxyamino)imidazole ribonucleotide synthase [Pigmentiphaga sp. NML080357]OVZ59682.1 5-(carboxyamino)imidazole ribonucleotide synthase [Pigmentiphaga sp. NML080357]
MTAGRTVQPGGWLGLLGGGQLGRMFCHAAQSMGYRVAVLDPIADCPAGAVADLHIRADYDDEAALAQLAERCAAVTTEFENVPAASLEKLAERCQVSPAAGAVAIAQDRIAEKGYIASIGVPVAPYAEIRSAADIDAASASLFPGILKVARLGYDGKGQARVESADEARAAFASFGGVPCVLEARLPLEFEISVVVARGFDGEVVTYPVSENVHRDGILAISTVPSPRASADIARRAAAAALQVAAGLDYCGVLCVEFFVLPEDRLIVNEIAPRPHNSGHYSIDACVTSQFEQQVRVLAGMPLGAPDLLASSVMLNVLGDIWFRRGDQAVEPEWGRALQAPSAKLHLYGKAEARRGRKMGHVTCLGADRDEAGRSAAQVAAALGIVFP